MCGCAVICGIVLDCAVCGWVACRQWLGCGWLHGFLLYVHLGNVLWVVILFLISGLLLCEWVECR